MRNLLCAFSLITLSLLQSCKDDESISADEQTKIESEITQRMNDYPQAIHRKDINWLHNFWLNDKNFAIASDGLLLVNYDSTVTKDYTLVFENMKEFQLKWSNTRINVMDEDIATFAAEFDWQLLNTSDTVKCRGAFLFVLKKYDSLWKIGQAGGTHNYYK